MSMYSVYTGGGTLTVFDENGTWEDSRRGATLPIFIVLKRNDRTDIRSSQKDTKNGSLGGISLSVVISESQPGLPSGNPASRSILVG